MLQDQGTAREDRSGLPREIPENPLGKSEDMFRVAGIADDLQTNARKKSRSLWNLLTAGAAGVINMSPKDWRQSVAVTRRCHDCASKAIPFDVRQ